MDKLTSMVADAETFVEWQRVREPLDGFANIAVVQDRHYSGIRCRSVPLQHWLKHYQRIPGRLTCGAHPRAATWSTRESGGATVRCVVRCPDPGRRDAGTPTHRSPRRWPALRDRKDTAVRSPGPPQARAWFATPTRRPWFAIAACPPRDPQHRVTNAVVRAVVPNRPPNGANEPRQPTGVSRSRASAPFAG